MDKVSESENIEEKLNGLSQTRKQNFLQNSEQAYIMFLNLHSFLKTFYEKQEDNRSKRRKSNCHPPVSFSFPEALKDSVFDNLFYSHNVLRGRGC